MLLRLRVWGFIFEHRSLRLIEFSSAKPFFFPQMLYSWIYNGWLLQGEGKGGECNRTSLGKLQE